LVNALSSGWSKGIFFYFRSVFIWPYNITVSILDNTNSRPKKKTILIFGISSFVGSNLAEFLKNDYRIIGTYRKTPITINGVLTVPCDVLSKEEVQLIIYAFKPDITIYCVGVSSVIQCSIREELSDALNTTGLVNVAEYCQRYKSQICYISSNFVFGGEDKNYIEMDIPDSITAYGKGQSAAEFYIQKTSLNYLIFRCCRLYGRSYSPLRNNWFEYVQKSFLNKSIMSLDDNIRTGFLDVSYLAMLFRIAFERKVTNRLFQISSNDICSHYEFVNTYAEVFNEETDIVLKGKWPLPVHSSHLLMSSKKSDDYNFRLDISNIEGFLNIKLPSIKESLEFSLERFAGHSTNTSKKNDGDVTFI
jgi:dTDP-4-dehydrorhamnose reductase